MIAVLAPEAVNRLLDQDRPTYPGMVGVSEVFHAVLRPDEEHISVSLSDEPFTGPSLTSRYHLDCFVTDSAPTEFFNSSAASYLLLCVTRGHTDPVSAFYFDSPGSTGLPCTVELIRIETDLFSRVRGIFDTDILAAKNVCVIGLGSGGSFGAVELAKSGVGQFTLVDFDRLHAHNVPRHVCGLNDVGRFKTRSVKDVILQHNPNAKVECLEDDVTADEPLLERVLATSDLVFAATDNELSKYLINEACLNLGVPAVYGGVYERAFAGEVIRVVPGRGGCYACVRQGLSRTPGILDRASDLDYTEAPDLDAEPGLGVDIGLIASLHTKVALTTLTRPSNMKEQDVDPQMIIWVNSAKPEDGELFATPLSRYFVHVPQVKDCPACATDRKV